MTNISLSQILMQKRTTECETVLNY